MAVAALPCSESQLPRCPGRPLCTVPVNRPSDISEGDHILYRVNDENYRPTYQSALIEKKLSGEGSFGLIVYAPEGVGYREQKFQEFNSLHKVKYVGGYSSEEAIKRARKRLKETYYHGLFNNSHHFVTFAKTSLEYSLTELVHGLQEPWKDDYELDPVLTVSTVAKLEDIKPADHIMDSSDHHWLVESIDLENSCISGFTVNGEKIIIKRLQWESEKYHRIEYPPNGSIPADVLQKARTELDTRSKWDGSDKFVTEKKWGKAYAFDGRCLLDSNCQPDSCTLVTKNTVVDLGDHLIVEREGIYRSVIIKSIIDTDTIVCTPDPDLESEELHGHLSISEESGVHRVNYSEHLPSRDILLRAESKMGQEILRSCRQEDTSLFVTWAIIGRKFSINAQELITNQKLKFVRPMFYKRIISSSQIQEGDHLFVPRTGYRWHFIVTERDYHTTRNEFKVAYYLHGKYQECTETVDPSELKVYKVIYSEEFAPEETICRARQKIRLNPEIHLDAWARMEFMSWAKTGSEEGMEVDLMTNSSKPCSKSSIACFQQLHAGDYLIVDESKMTPYHHCLVLEVKSPDKCTVMEVWNRGIKQVDIQLNKEYKYYKLNYSMGTDVCRTAEESIQLAKEQKKKTKFFSDYNRQTFINYLKTGEDSVEVEINSLQDDRILLHREEVKNAMQLKKGDHIERPIMVVGEIGGYFHHMLVLQPIDECCCVVLHHTSDSGNAIRKEQVNIFEVGTVNSVVNRLTKRLKVSRVMYTECVDEDKRIDQLLKFAKGDYHSASQDHQDLIRLIGKYKLFKNNCEHMATYGAIGCHMSIQVDVTVHEDLHRINKQVIAMSPELGDACVRAASKGAAEAVANVAGSLLKQTAVNPILSLFQGATSNSVSAVLANSFKVGYTATLSATSIGLVSAIALGVNAIIEAPLLSYNIYKIHRKRKFDKISRTEMKRQCTVEGCTSAGTVALGVGGAVVGQIVIPIPVIGAAAGGLVGTLAGKGSGYLIGNGISLFIADKDVDLSPVVPQMFVMTQNNVLFCSMDMHNAFL